LGVKFFEALFAQAISVMFFQIGFCGVGKLHLDAPTVDGMHAFEGFSATGTDFYHLLICLFVIEEFGRIANPPELS